jgi:poly-gamma-glutamate synthesis protein (capsule biosynthesis protein)
MIEVLKSALFDIVSLANNHTYDFDDKGLDSTIDTLEKNNILYVGAGQNLEEARALKIVNKDGLKIGFLAYSSLAYSSFSDKNQVPAANETKSGVAPIDAEYILEDIKKNRDKCDLLFVSLHWGIEYTHVPQESQRELAYKIIDAGADGILGHHAHNLQGIEIYKYKPIIYSMSNFIFDQNADLNKDSGIFKLKYIGKNFKGLEFTPLRIEDKKRTVVAEGEARRKILDHMIKFSKVLDTEFEEKDGKLYFVIKN